MARPVDVLVVDDNRVDGQRMLVALRMVFAQRIKLRSAAAVADMVHELATGEPDIVLLDDRMDASRTAEDTVPLLRQRGYSGPIVILGGALDARRQAQLKRLQIEAFLHKDDADTSRLAGLILDLTGLG